MLKFTRTKYVTLDRPTKDKIVAHGILEDYIYAMDLDVEFSFPDCEITAITGKMRRYTTPECPSADKILQGAVGMRIESGLTNRVKKEIGRAGCRHYATLLLECCHAVISAWIGFAKQDLEDEGLPVDDDAVRRRLLEQAPNLKNSCMVYSEESALMKRLSG